MLTGAQIGQLRDFMREYFTIEELDQMLYIRLEKRRVEDFAPRADIAYLSFRILQSSNMQGWDDELINALIAERPSKTQLLRVAMDRGISMNMYDETSQKKLSRASLETLVNNEPNFNPSQILEGISKNKRCVCRVQVSHKGVSNYGTGFLVGADRLLSNYHVFERVIKDRTAAKGVTCKFDFEIGADGMTINQGLEIGLASDVDPILAFSEYGPGDTAGSADIDGIEWPADKLDYALVKLEREIGNEAFGPNAEDVALLSDRQEARGWIKVPQNAPDLSKGQHMFIFQHPNKQPIKVNIGLSKVEGTDKNGNRVRYQINTEHGSSGSPCFDHKFDWSAIHNMGDPDWHGPYNQGIPAVRVVADLIRQGITL